ncbi:Bystin-domain-containing protein [Xylariaceae sp. FL0016]|nr:Bystin-domain-containing protein [Xylariaceae sp. FL0016]
MPKATTPTAGRQRRTLEDEYLAPVPLKNKAPKNRKSKSEEDEGRYVDSKSSQKILQMGRELAEEIDAAAPRPPPESNAFGFESRFDEEETEQYPDEDEVWGDEDEVVEEIDIEPGDLDTFNKFLPAEEDPLLTQGEWTANLQPGKQQGGGTSLADLILAKIAARESGVDDAQGMEYEDEDTEVSPKVIEVFTKVGIILSRYKSGKLPKPFKILPTIPNWETIIEYTKPDEWTPNAVFAATRIFVSSQPIVVRRFIEIILLDRCRDDIHEHKKLNVHLFNALKKALYKPASFMKGFLFPLAESGTCTLKEAQILSAILARVSIPVLHSGAAIKGLCEIAAREASAGTEGGGAVNVFIKTLLDKKYALPYQVVDSLVFHFLRFRSVDPAAVTDANAMDFTDERAASRARLPVIWHQTLLSFAERYKHEITEDQREALLDLLLTHGHHKIGPEIRRELLAGRGRGVVAEPEGPAFDGDDTMIVDA